MALLSLHTIHQCPSLNTSTPANSPLNTTENKALETGNLSMKPAPITESWIYDIDNDASSACTSDEFAEDIEQQKLAVIIAVRGIEILDIIQSFDY
jgi:hypothetical protein